MRYQVVTPATAMIAVLSTESQKNAHRSEIPSLGVTWGSCVDPPGEVVYGKRYSPGPEVILRPPAPDVLMASVRPPESPPGPNDLGREPREARAGAGRLQHQHVQVRGRVTRGVGVPLCELVQDEQGVLVGLDAEGPVDVDTEPLPEDREELAEVHLGGAFGVLGATEEADDDAGGQSEHFPSGKGARVPARLGLEAGGRCIEDEDRQLGRGIVLGSGAERGPRRFG